ncbi:hypothetical protein CC85DRAFT_289424 [Cutaneotrichosporon oleaginosum]|uniref:Uncharacterized protein n=1 Tax=Cutaneotrichosporon oleaginosum TaxID=879819 RepID=A0A0J0XBU7_9TREE|nr:uncharacterized protein CC85DRAFT_289424 [Cutaneotrichosporon oleaginosum]KLT38535.1 hypothetical protein CC85DRAFT_289424 [Cutaneotrichosporon oleaginosum]TXT08582.1 hypothetical protein COLE_05506 [Cutaneotrichosporon oleaginosum]
MPNKPRLSNESDSTQTSRSNSCGSGSDGSNSSDNSASHDLSLGGDGVHSADTSVSSVSSDWTPFPFPRTEYPYSSTPRWPLCASDERDRYSRAVWAARLASVEWRETAQSNPEALVSLNLFACAVLDSALDRMYKARTDPWPPFDTATDDEYLLRMYKRPKSELPFAGWLRLIDVYIEKAYDAAVKALPDAAADKAPPLHGPVRGLCRWTLVHRWRPIADSFNPPSYRDEQNLPPAPSLQILGPYDPLFSEANTARVQAWHAKAVEEETADWERVYGNPRPTIASVANMISDETELNDEDSSSLDEEEWEAVTNPKEPSSNPAPRYISWREYEIMLAEGQSDAWAPS